MPKQSKNLRVILIGGPSNVGKSTLAQHLAEGLGWSDAATDRRTRYPGHFDACDYSPAVKSLRVLQEDLPMYGGVKR